MTKVEVKKSIQVEAAEAWFTLSSFKGIENFSPIEKSVVTGSGPGAKRSCYLPDGARIDEILNIVDGDIRHLQYAITQGPFPIQNYVSDIHISDAKPGTCEVTWGCSFDSAPEAENEMKALFEGFYHTIIDSLEDYLKKN